jgi:hypothetical protein
MFVLHNSEGVAIGFAVRRRNPFRVGSINWMRLSQGWPKPNPGLKLANAFSVKFKLHQYLMLACLPSSPQLESKITQTIDYLAGRRVYIEFKNRIN